MTPDRRRLWLGAMLAGAAALVAWDRLAAPTPELVAPTRAAAVASEASAPARALAIARLAPRTDYVEALRDAAAAVPPPVAATPPVALASAPDAPAPPPWRVIGKGRVDGAWEVYLAQSNHVVVARAGDRLDGQYEVVAIAPPSLQLMFLPTREARTLPIGGAFED